MVNKILLSLVWVLLFVAILVVFLSKSTAIPYKSNSFNSPSRIEISSSILKLKAEPDAQSHNQSSLRLSDDIKRTQQIVGTDMSDLGSQLSRNSKVEANSISTSKQLLVYGLVTDLSGLPIEGVVVTESGQYSGTKTDNSGRFELALSSLKKSYHAIIFRRAGYEEKVNHLLNKDFLDKTKIVLNTNLSYSAETVTLNGRIGEPAGQAVQGVIIKLSSLQNNLYYSTTSDEKGNFSFEGIKQNVNYQVRVVPSANYQTIELEDIWMAADTPPVNIQLQPVNLLTLDGIVVDRFGGYVPDLKINIRSETNSTYEKEIITDDLGRFELVDFPTGEILFFTLSPKFYKVRGRALSESSAMNMIVPIDVGSRVVSGWVRDENGQPVSNARIMMDAEFKIDNVISSSLLTSNTDATGYFEFDNVGGGEHFIAVYAKGFNNQGVSYNTNSRIDQIYFDLTPGNTSLINSESLKMKFAAEQGQESLQ